MFFQQILDSIFAPITYIGHTHYVIGPLFHFSLGLPVVLGIFIAVYRAFKNKYAAWQLYILFFIPALFLAGALTPYRELTVTRLHFLVPFWLIAAGLVFEVIQKHCSRYLFVCIIALYIFLTPQWSWAQFTDEVTHKMSFHECAAGIKLLEENPDKKFIFLEEWFTLPYVTNVYHYNANATFLYTIPKTLEPHTYLILREQTKLKIPHKMECMKYKVVNDITFTVCASNKKTLTELIHER